jgi:hypothetical protein
MSCNVAGCVTSRRLISHFKTCRNKSILTNLSRSEKNVKNCLVCTLAMSPYVNDDSKYSILWHGLDEAFPTLNSSYFVDGKSMSKNNATDGAKSLPFESHFQINGRSISHELPSDFIGVQQKRVRCFSDNVSSFGQDLRYDSGDSMESTSPTLSTMLFRNSQSPTRAFIPSTIIRDDSLTSHKVSWFNDSTQMFY